MYTELLAEWVYSKDTDISSDLCSVELIHCGEVKITVLFLLIFPALRTERVWKWLLWYLLEQGTEQKQTYSTL